MRLTIHDVGLGQCITLEGGNKQVWMWDCGSSDKFSPSDFLASKGYSSIERLIITNYDQDHISDLPNLRSRFDIEYLRNNSSITSAQLKSLKQKSGPITDAMKSMLEMMDNYHPVDGPLDRICRMSICQCIETLTVHTSTTQTTSVWSPFSLATTPLSSFPATSKRKDGMGF